MSPGALAFGPLMADLLPSRVAWETCKTVSIGASESAAILGVSPWKSAFQLYHEKKGTERAPQGESLARELGLLLEDPIAQLYRQRTKRTVIRPEPDTFRVARHANPKLDYMVATLDGVQVYTSEEADPRLFNAVGVLEIKTAAITKAGAWLHEVPIDYQVQVQHQLAVTGAEFATIVALIGGVTLKFADIFRDQAFIDLLEAAVAEWWGRFERNEPPPIEGTEATKEFLRRLYKREDPVRVQLPPEAREWDAELQKAKAAAKAATATATYYENQLLNAIGHANLGDIGDGISYTLKTQSRKGYTVAETTYRTLRRWAPKVSRQALKPGTAPQLEGLRDRFEDERLNEEADRDSLVEDFEP